MTLVEWDPAWPARFERERARIRRALGAPSYGSSTSGRPQFGVLPPSRSSTSSHGQTSMMRRLRRPPRARRLRTASPRPGHRMSAPRTSAFTCTSSTTATTKPTATSPSAIAYSLDGRPHRLRAPQTRTRRPRLAGDRPLRGRQRPADRNHPRTRMPAARLIRPLTPPTPGPAVVGQHAVVAGGDPLAEPRHSVVEPSPARLLLLSGSGRPRRGSPRRPPVDEGRAPGAVGRRRPHSPGRKQACGAAQRLLLPLGPASAGARYVSGEDACSWPIASVACLT